MDMYQVMEILKIKYVRYVQNVSSQVIWKIETFIEEDTRYNKHYTYDNDTSVPFKVGTLGPHAVLSIAISCPIIFSWISLMFWNLFSFKSDFSFGKRQKSPGTKSGLSLSHWGDLMFHKKYTLHEMWCMCGCDVVMKLPITSCP